MIRGQKSFEKYNQLSLIEIKIEDNRLIDVLRNRNVKYRFIPIDLLLSSGIKNDTNQIFIVNNGLSNAKDSLINRKIYKN